MTTSGRPKSRLDLNILPQRHRPRRLTPEALLSWILLLALIGLLVPSWQWFARTTADYERTAQEGEALRGAIGLSGPASEALDALATQVDVEESRAAELEGAIGSLGIRRVVWSDVLPVIVSRAPEGITLAGIGDSGDSILLEGLASSETLPLAYAAALSAAGVFDLVQVDSIDRLTEEATSTPTPRASASATPQAPSPPPSRFAFTMTLVVGAGGTP
jgi:Tfp pilus assembly protein PilN